MYSFIIYTTWAYTSSVLTEEEHCAVQRPTVVLHLRRPKMYIMYTTLIYSCSAEGGQPFTSRHLADGCILCAWVWLQIISPALRRVKSWWDLTSTSSWRLPTRTTTSWSGVWFFFILSLFSHPLLRLPLTQTSALEGVYWTARSF
jgi:hypothetical protein